MAGWSIENGAGKVEGDKLVKLRLSSRKSARPDGPGRPPRLAAAAVDRVPAPAVDRGPALAVSCSG